MAHPQLMTDTPPAVSTRPLYGCMGLGGPWDAPAVTAADITQAEAVVEAALNIGITSFDHADIYGNGKAESVFGELLSRSPELRDAITLQTKVGIRLPTGEAPGLYDLRAGTIATRVRQSLDRLRTDRIDVLLLHRPDPLTPPAEVAAALTALHDEGVVGAFGVSNMSAAQIGALQTHLDQPLVVNQLEMSLYRRDWVEAGVLVNTAAATANGFPHGTLEYCTANGIGLQAWGSMAQGRYTGRAGGDAAEQATTALVASLAAAKNTTPETIVLWWLQRHPAGIAPTIGTTDTDRIAACGDAVTRAPDLTHDEWYRLWTTARGVGLP